MIGINDCELDLSIVDRRKVMHILPKRTFIQCGTCVFCESQDMPKDAAPGTACQTHPSALTDRLVHCLNPKCIASARFVFHNLLCTYNQFFVNKRTVTELFPVENVLVPRSSGQTSPGKIDLKCPFIVDNEGDICVVCSVENNSRYKYVPVKDLLKNNYDLQKWWDSDKFHVLYEAEMRSLHPNLFAKIDSNLKKLNLF